MDQVAARTKRRSGLLAAAAASVCLVASLFTSSVSALKGGVSQNDLIGRLASSDDTQFEAALDELVQLDEARAIRAWSAALRNGSPELRDAAWRRYRRLQINLNRNTSVPQVVRIFAQPDKVLQASRISGTDVTIWSSSSEETIAAAPPYLVARLERSQIQCDVLYDTIADWQRARSDGDGLAIAITPEYQSPEAASRAQLRIAVIDLSKQSPPQAGFSDWFGDGEDILMRQDSRLAYLDRFESDGSQASIEAHIRQRYTDRGYHLAAYYTPDEFAEAAPRWFPGKSFNAGTKPGANPSAGFRPLLAEGRFHSYDETVAEFKSLAGSHPDLAAYVKLGTSYEGRDIFALKISRTPKGNDPTKPDILITGCHHAREWISVEAPVYFANQLLRGYEADPSIKFLVDNLQIWIVPIVNPDGLTYSQGAANDELNGVRTWRKNRRPISVSACASNVGVDLNRNYDFEWRLPQDSPCEDYCSLDKSCLHDDIGASDDPRDETYRGPSAESEPEVRAMKSLVDDPTHHFRAQIDYHNYSQLILYPWSFENTASPDADLLAALGDRMSTELRGVNNVLYRPEQAINLYPTTGSSADYAYGVNHVAAPFVVEMRPECCNFNVPESQISAVNQENWAAASPLLEWAAGPPILQAVKAYTRSDDGSFSTLAYAGHWVPSTDLRTGRDLVIDIRLDGIRAGPLLVELQFSKPMDTSLVPRATLGRDGKADEVTVTAVGGNEGWSETVYPNDTWVGEAEIFQDFNDTSPWSLSVEAKDTFGTNTDARPSTIADYVTGMGGWRNFEDSSGQGSAGGIDMSHTLAPTIRDDFPGIFIAWPAAGQRFAAGDTLNLAWTVARGESFDPASQRIFLSTDSGGSFTTIATGLSGSTDKYGFRLPAAATAHARLRIQAIDRLTGNSVFGDSRGEFTIGANVGAGIEVSVISSERIELGWSDVSADGNATVSGPTRLAIDLMVTNRGSVAVVNPFIRAAQLTRSNVLLSRNAGSPSGEGARQSIGTGGDDTLAPGESVRIRVVVGAVVNKKFKFSIGMFGVPSGGAIAPAGSVRVWKGKPKST